MVHHLRLVENNNAPSLHMSLALGHCTSRIPPVHQKSCSLPGLVSSQHAGLNRRRRRKLIITSAQNKKTPKNEALEAASEEYAQGVKSGEDPEEIVRRQLGLQEKGDLTEAEQQYVLKAKAKIEEVTSGFHIPGDKSLKRLKEIEQSKKQPAFRFGEICYGTGEYAKACLAFQVAVKDAGSETVAGGEASLWLALCFQALGKEEECLDLYKDLKENHPNSKIRKRAADLLFIMEAPKLRVREDERVKMPVLNLERNSGRRGNGYRSGGGEGKKKIKQSWEDEFWNTYEPPKYVRNRYFWIATSIVTVCLIVYSVSQKAGHG